MTRDLGAIVAPSFDLATAINQYELLDGREQRTLAEIRLAKGRILRDAYKGLGVTKGDRSGRWADFLARVKVSDETARNYMRLAGHVDDASTSQNVREVDATIPTYRDAGIVKAPAAARPDPEPTPLVDDTPPESKKNRARPVGDACSTGPSVALVSVGGDVGRSVPGAPSDWARQLAGLVDDMSRHIKAAFAKVEQIEALCAEHEASVASPALLTTRSMLAAVKATVADVLKKMEPTNGSH